MEDLKLLKTKEVAEALRVGECYVRELIKRGELKAYREGNRGGYRILPREVDNYITARIEETASAAIDKF